MIVSPNVRGVLPPASPGGGHRESRCSLSMLGPEMSATTITTTASTRRTDGGENQTDRVPSIHARAPRLLPLSLMSPSTSCSDAEADDEGQMSSPASSGYGRSGTSEADEPESPVLTATTRNRETTGRYGGWNGSGRRRTRDRDRGDEEEERRRRPHFSPAGCSVRTLTCDAELPSTSSSLPSRHPLLSTVVGRLLSEEDIDSVASLGEGFFSEVFKVRVRATGEVLVLKVAKTRGERRATHVDVAREAAMLKRLEHPNVLALRGLVVARGVSGAWDIHLLVDFCAGGSLSRLLLDKTECISWRRRLSYAVDISAGMSHIHARRVIHRDLTSMNVLIANGRAVIADFGLSADFPRPAEKLPQVGTTYFMSPECLKEQYYDEKSDVFSFGIILCQLIARIDADPECGMHRTADFGLNYALFASYCPHDSPQYLLTIAFSCCLMNPASRPPFASLLKELSKLRDSCAVEGLNLSVDSNDPSRADISPGRLERSRSDAALRKTSKGGPNPSHARKLSSLKNSGRTITEGVEDSGTTAIEAAARDAETRGERRRGAEEKRPTKIGGVHTGDAEVQTRLPRDALSPLNPFLRYERFTKNRKIVPARESECERDKKDERTDDIEMDGTGGGRRRAGRLLRRCSSLPSEMDAPPVGGEWRSSDDEDSLDEYDDEDDSAFEGAGTIPLAFRAYDQKFLRQSKRFSRRFTVVGGATPSSAPAPAPRPSSLSPSPSSVTVLPLPSPPLSPDCINNNPEPLTKYSSWPKRKESRVRSEEGGFGAGICRSRNASASRVRQACSIL